MSEIVVSYERSTASHAQIVARALRALGYDVWLDDELPAHRRYERVIKEQIRAAKAVVVIWSAEAAESDWVRSEANQAREARKLVQLTIDNAPLPMPFEQTHCVDMRGWTGDPTSPSWRKVLASVADLTGGPIISATPDSQISSALLRKNSICVLPFVNMSADPEQEYFSDGISEDIITDLSKVSALFVIARTTAFTFKAKSVDAQRVAHQLGVSHVLEGSVRRAGSRVRITAQLIDGATGGHLWAERYDRDLTDIFAVQDEIAGAVAKELRAKLAIAKDALGTTTESVEAYNELLKGRALIGYSNDESGFAAATHFERATELDSNYGAAYGELAIAHALNSVYAAVADVGTDWSAAFTRALEINPNDSNALAAKAYYITLTKSDWKQAGALYERAVQFGISSHAAILYGTMYLAPLSKWAEMQAFYNAILNVDPYRTDILMDYAEWHMNHGTHHEAIALWKRVLEVQPDATDAWAGIGDSYAALGDHSAARAALQKVQLPMKLAWYSNRYLKALWALGDRETVMHLVAEYEREPKYRAPLIFIYLIIGEIDKALSSFEAAYAASDWPSLFIKSVPSTAVLQGHPRYEALLEKMHLDDPSLREAGLL